jgi:hypothetical protein
LPIFKAGRALLPGSRGGSNNRGHLLLEFPFATDGQYIVFYADVEMLGIDVRQIRSYDQFMFGFLECRLRVPKS